MVTRAVVPFTAVILAALAAQPRPAAAFPLLDPSNQDTLPGSVSDLAAPDAADLQHQLQIANGFAAPAGGGWTILPRVSIEQVLNDNENQVTAPRQPDLMTLVSPGVSVIGDLPRLQMRFDYAPAVEINLPDGPQNAVIQQLNGTGLVTVVPDLAYVDVRAFAGASAINGLVGANGAAGSAGQIGTGEGISGSSNTIGLASQDRSQTSTVAISPYLLHTFGDWGTGKLGVSLTAASSDQTTGFLAAPFPSGGANGSTTLAREETGQFTTGDFLAEWQDTASFDLLQATSTTNQYVSATGQVAAIPSTQINSEKELVSDKISYAVTHWADVFITFGHEDIDYSNASFRRIDDITWSAGITAEPDPDSQITLSYGHQNGSNSIQAVGRYAFSARTVITGSYSDTLGTQLEEIGQQLQLGEIGPSGQFINGSNGAPLLFNVYETLTVPEVFQYRTFNLNVQTLLDRDMIGLTAIVGEQNSAGGGVQTTANTRSATIQWRHDLSPDLSFNAYAAYTNQSQAGGRSCTGTLAAACAANTTGSLSALVLGASLNYTLTETLTGNLRYLFTDRVSTAANESMYQDLIVIGITKQF